MRKITVIGGALAFVLATGLPAAASTGSTGSPEAAVPVASTVSANTVRTTASAASVGAVRAAAPAGTKYHWGPVRSAAGHSGRAAADVWVSDFSAETFVVSGTLRDRDAHRGHCAYVRARFHYAGGGTGWARPSTTCRASTPFRLSSDGEITRVDVRVCLLDAGRVPFRCHADPIKAETIAGWPR
ncbi:hypothetical protein [Streptosporangium pseudovulgare]|uniref:Uncharacterized protein n=1 Tax=Streptosporangium pseudovulgare TaxID=35765 RepID=A0ABQ2R4M4_9ACTN|nr:hypothetical protein [Streptosporangium pseudovulgare]GGQ12019.1 hypothetical protein GCM10010140_47860 [Streptosporangium pseudovulgare]